LNAVRTKNTLLETKAKPFADYSEFGTQTIDTSPGHNLPKAIKKPVRDKEEKTKALYLSTHIDELTNDIEQLKNSLLGSNRGMDEIKEEIDYMSPIEEKESNSCWFQNDSHVFGDCSGVLNKENGGKFNKLQEEYNKIKVKLTEYQQNNELYLNEIKSLKEQLSNHNGETATTRALRAKLSELEREREVLISGSQEELNEYKIIIANLQKQLENYKQQIVSLEQINLQLKLEKEQLEMKIGKKLPLMGYLKKGKSNH